MSLLEYYLFCKKRCDNIIKYLEEINNENELFFSATESLDMNNTEYIIDRFNLIENREIFKSKLKYMNELKRIYERNIFKLCEHEYEEDMIDITPERSEKITYCRICEHTK